MPTLSAHVITRWLGADAPDSRRTCGPSPSPAGGGDRLHGRVVERLPDGRRAGGRWSGPRSTGAAHRGRLARLVAAAWPPAVTTTSPSPSSRHHRPSARARLGIDKGVDACRPSRSSASRTSILPEGGTEVNAIVTVTATGTARRPVGPRADAGADGARRAEIIMIDASGSMDGKRIREARAAAAAAIDCLEDGVRFAVVAGNHAAWRLYPDIPGMGLAVVVAGRRARMPPRVPAAQGRRGNGHRYVGSSWPRDCSASRAGINHAILLTDGKDEGESPAGSPAGARRGRRGVPVRLPGGRDRLGRRRAPQRVVGPARGSPTSSPIRRASQRTSRP